MPEETPNTEKKLYVDEDWKSQVEAEKEAARDGKQEPAPSETAPEPAADQLPPLPPASLSFLIGTMYMQGAMSLGLLPNPVTQKRESRPAHAQHTIDMLAVLQEKTAGNRTMEESEELEAVLHELRMAFITVQGK